MPGKIGTPLKNQRHERFAQLLVSGKTADAAYVEAGYSPNRGNAVTLKAKQNIQKRILELTAPAAEKAALTVEGTLKELARAVNADPEEEVTWPVKLAAIDKAMRFHGLFERDNMQKPAPQPIQVQVVMIGPK